MFREVLTPWLDRDTRRELRHDLALRPRVMPAWFQRVREDRWLVHDGIKRIADDLRAMRSAAAGDRRDPPVLP